MSDEDGPVCRIHVNTHVFNSFYFHYTEQIMGNLIEKQCKFAIIF